jgi:SAM-dependent methyltransferase
MMIASLPHDEAMKYDRVKKEIVAYNDMARSKRDDLEQLTNNLIGRRLVAMVRRGEKIPRFPTPLTLWIDSVSDPVAQGDAYHWLGSIEGKSFLQLGGSGSHAVKAAIAGAHEVTLLTPMVEEGRVGQKVAEYVGIGIPLEISLGVGEQLPFADGSFDVIYGGATLHHTLLPYALPEIARILRPGGRASFVDPNLNLMYKVLEVTHLRELARVKGAQCYPIRVSDVYDNAGDFQTVRCEVSGGLSRYAIVGLNRVLHLKVPLKLSLLGQSMETAVMRRLRLTGTLGGLAVLLEK